MELVPEDIRWTWAAEAKSSTQTSQNSLCRVCNLASVRGARLKISDPSYAVVTADDVVVTKFEYEHAANLFCQIINAAYLRAREHDNDENIAY